jgi:hypothetical protein
LKRELKGYLIVQSAAVKFITVLTLPLLLSSCQSASSPAPESVSPVGQTAYPGRFLRCYDLDSSASELRLLVYKTGPLARVGHNHVMVSHGLTGSLARNEPFSSSRARVVLGVASLEIDPEALRSDEGTDFASDVSDEARAGTRTNMLSAGVLDAELFPEVQVELLSVSGPSWSADANVRIRLKDQVREKTVTVSLLEDSEGITAISSFSVLQTQFGMTPFSVLGGGLRVADEMKIRVNLRFVPRAADNGSSCIVSMDQDGEKP